MNKTEHIKKKAIIDALIKSLGVVTTACKIAGIGRTTFYEWLNNDTDFKKEIEDIQNVALDFAESELFKQIQNGNTSATIFYLKCRGKKRGYYEKQQIDMTTDDEPIKININLNDRNKPTTNK